VSAHIGGSVRTGRGSAVVAERDRKAGSPSSLSPSMSGLGRCHFRFRDARR
jgi:hypothetical protein